MERRRAIEEREKRKDEKGSEKDKPKNVRGHEKQLGWVVSYGHNTS